MQRRLPWVCHQCSLRQSSWCRHWWTSWLWCQTPLLFLCGTWSGRRNCERTQTHHRQNSGGRWRDKLDLVNHEYTEATRPLNSQTHFSENYYNSEGRWTHYTFKQTRCSRSRPTGTLTLLRHNTKTNTSRWRSGYSLTYASPKCPLLHRNASLPGQCQTQSDILSFDWTKLKCKIAVLKPIRCKCIRLHSVTVYTSLFLQCNLYLKVGSHPTPPHPIPLNALTLFCHSAASRSWCRWPGSQPPESQSEQSRSLWSPSRHTQPAKNTLVKGRIALTLMLVKYECEYLWSSLVFSLN